MSSFAENLKDLKDYQDWINSCRMNISDAKDDLDSAVSTIESETEDLFSYSNGLEESIDAIETNYEELEEDYNKLQDEYNDLEKKYNDLHERYGEVEDKELKTCDVMLDLLRVNSLPYVMMALGHVFAKGFDNFTDENVKEAETVIESEREWNDSEHTDENGHKYISVMTTDCKLQIVRMAAKISKLPPWDVFAWMKANLPLADKGYKQFDGGED